MEAAVAFQWSYDFPDRGVPEPQNRARDVQRTKRRELHQIQRGNIAAN